MLILTVTFVILAHAGDSGEGNQDLVFVDKLKDIFVIGFSHFQKKNFGFSLLSLLQYSFFKLAYSFQPTPMQLLGFEKKNYFGLFVWFAELTYLFQKIG